MLEPKRQQHKKLSVQLSKQYPIGSKIQIISPVTGKSYPAKIVKVHDADNIEIHSQGDDHNTIIHPSTISKK